MNRMLSRLFLAMLFLVVALPATSQAASITSSAPTVGLGSQVIDLTLDPMGESAGAWIVVLGTSGGLTIDSIAGVVPGGTDCFGLTSAASFDGQCAAMPLNGSALVAQVQITATMPGGTLSLVSGNITDFDTFVDTAFTPGVLTTVVPEPGTASLMMLGLLGLAWQRRRVSSEN